MGFVQFAFFVCFISVTSSEVWKCDDGLSINSAWRCDGQFDCLDWSDENPDNCPPRECSPSEYKCNNGMCISDVLVCNGEYDCMGDQSDESNCTYHNVDCDVTLFHMCGNNMCIPMEWRCDNEDDCGDNSDEMGCSNVCLNGHVICNKTGLCISEHWICDGVKDCVDGEDESHCGQADPPTPANPCNISAFQCDGNCYSIFRACDGRNDCVDGLDEGLTCQVSTCRLRKNDDFIRNMNGGEIVCDHLCIATPSGPRCYCHPGFSLEANGFECKVDGVSPSLYFSSSNQIRRITLHASSLMRSDDVIVVDPNQNASITAIQYDTNTNILFWLDSNSGNIHTMTASGQQRVIANVPGVTSLAFDWLTYNLYVTRLTPPSVGVIPLTSDATPTTTTPIHVATYQAPTCIALLPHKGLMIVCDHGNPSTNPHLTLLNMDGTSPRTFHTTDLPHLHAVAVDVITDLVYWGETGAGVARVRVKSLDGSHQKVILSSAMGNSPIQYPSSISMFEDDLYFTDPHMREVWRLDSISGKATNFEGGDNEPIVKVAMSDKVLAVHVAHPVQQRAHQPNPCATSMCTHACVNQPMGSRCLCPPSKILGHDGKTCIDIPTTTTTATRATVTSPTTSVMSQPTIMTSQVTPMTSQATPVTSQPHCHHPTHLENTVSSMVVMHGYQVGTTLKFQCKPGSHGEGDIQRDTFVITCSRDGSWDELPSCVLFTCDDMRCGEGVCVDNINGSYCLCNNGTKVFTSCSQSFIDDVIMDSRPIIIQVVVTMVVLLLIIIIVGLVWKYKRHEVSCSRMKRSQPSGALLVQSPQDGSNYANPRPQITTRKQRKRLPLPDDPDSGMDRSSSSLSSSESPGDYSYRSLQTTVEIEDSEHYDLHGLRPAGGVRGTLAAMFNIRKTESQEHMIPHNS